jgi:spore coat protein U-like protein
MEGQAFLPFSLVVLLESFMRSRFPAVAMGLALASLGLPILAATTTSTFNATSSVVSACTITNNPGVAFGQYDAVTNKTAPVNANSSLSVLCTKGAAVSVGIDQGQTPLSGSTCITPQRQMKSAAGDFLRYGVFVFTDAANPDEASAWGCDASNAATFTSASGLTPQVLNTVNNIRAGQDVPAGAYSDTVTVTVKF